MSRRLDHNKHRHRGKERGTDEAIERALSPAPKPRPAWGRAADRRKAEQAERLIAAGEVWVTKCPPTSRPHEKPQALVLSPAMAEKVAAALAKVAADRAAREKGRGS